MAEARATAAQLVRADGAHPRRAASAGDGDSLAARVLAELAEPRDTGRRMRLATYRQDNAELWRN